MSSQLDHPDTEQLFEYEAVALDLLGLHIDVMACLLMVVFGSSTRIEVHVDDILDGLIGIVEQQVAVLLQEALMGDEGQIDPAEITETNDACLVHDVGVMSNLVLKHIRPRCDLYHNLEHLSATRS